MKPAAMPDTIFAHPALAGKTLMVRQGPHWAAFEIRADGTAALRQSTRLDDPDPTWHGGFAR